jgi:DNA-binding transcriptional MerR regulator
MARNGRRFPPRGDPLEPSPGTGFLSPLFEEKSGHEAERFRGIRNRGRPALRRQRQGAAVYGLLKPPRTEAGWRVYRQAECERLSVIIALRQLGLPLRRIGELLRGKADLASVLALQEAALEEVRDKAEEALSLVRAARARLSKRRSLSPDELGNLVRRTAMSDLNWSPKLEALAQKHYAEALHEGTARGIEEPQVHAR